MLYAAAADTVPQLKTIGDWAFYNCHELASVALPEGVRSVGKAAFYGCTKIAGITLPSSLNTIGNNAFALCESLKRMDINATTPPEIDSETFYKVGRTVPVYVPDGSVADYKAAQYRRELNIQSANAPSDTDNVEATPEFTVDGNSIVFTEETEVAIYTVAGIRVYSGITQSVTLPHSGIYVVVTPNTSTRIAIQR